MDRKVRAVQDMRDERDEPTEEDGLFQHPISYGSWRTGKPLQRFQPSKISFGTLRGWTTQECCLMNGASMRKEQVLENSGQVSDVAAGLVGW